MYSHDPTLIYCVKIAILEKNMTKDFQYSTRSEIARGLAYNFIFIVTLITNEIKTIV